MMRTGDSRMERINAAIRAVYADGTFAALEDKWVAAAEAKGLKNARAVLDEFRAETQKLK